jgi:hypothetical protein
MRPITRRSVVRPLWIGAILLLAACTRELVQPVDGAIVLIPGDGAATARLDRADIVSSEIVGDRLHLRVQHAGGCARHDFALIHSGVFMESLPVQTRLQLAHDANGDNCRALLTRDLSFDLAPLKAAYQQAYGSRGPLIVHLIAPGGGAAPARPLRYEF